MYENLWKVGGKVTLKQHLSGSFVQLQPGEVGEIVDVKQGGVIVTCERWKALDSQHPQLLPNNCQYYYDGYLDHAEGSAGHILKNMKKWAEYVQ